MITHSTPIIALLPSGMEWLWVLLIVVLFFGGAKLPALAKGLGQSIKEFKKAQKDEDAEKPADAKPAAPATPSKTNDQN